MDEIRRTRIALGIEAKSCYTCRFYREGATLTSCEEEGFRAWRDATRHMARWAEIERHPTYQGLCRKHDKWEPKED